jgi:hypothetical protein
MDKELKNLRYWSIEDREASKVKIQDKKQGQIEFNLNFNLN